MKPLVSFPCEETGGWTVRGKIDLDEIHHFDSVAISDYLAINSDTDKLIDVMSGNIYGEYSGIRILINNVNTDETELGWGKINEPHDIIKFWKHSDFIGEKLFFVLMDEKKHVETVYWITQSNSESVVININEMMDYFGYKKSQSVMVSHNHPSGSLALSMEDMFLTERIYAYCENMGIELLDHVIISCDGINSILEKESY